MRFAALLFLGNIRLPGLVIVFPSTLETLYPHFTWSIFLFSCYAWFFLLLGMSLLLDIILKVENLIFWYGYQVPELKHISAQNIHNSTLFSQVQRFVLSMIIGLKRGNGAVEYKFMKTRGLA